METELHEINVTLSKNQKERIRKAFHNREKILLRLKNDALRGSDTLLVPSKTLESLKNDLIIHAPKFDEFMKNFSISFPTIVERLEEKRNTYEGMSILLDYSLITELTKDSIRRNIENL